MNPLAPDLDPQLSAALQTEMDRLRHAASGGSTWTEERLARLTEECAEIVRRWALTSERHARAVERFETHLSEWSEAGARLQEDAAHRIQELERIIHHEWGELKELHEEPIRQLAEHATSLTQVCIATANVAQQGFERSEARLAAIETDLNEKLTELTRELQHVVAELRSTRPAQPRLGTGATPWPLEGVTRLHDQLRGEGPPGIGAIDVTASPVAAPAAQRLLPEAATELNQRIATLERTVTEHEAAAREAVATREDGTRAWRVAAIAMGVVFVLALVFAWQLRGDVQLATAQVEQAQRQQEAAADAAAREVAAARAEAERQVADARARADRAQIMANVLAAPDTARYNLIGRAALTGASAQVLWSRSQGLVFSGSTIAPPPPNAIYQIWLLIRGGAVKAGTFTPDAAGNASVALTPPLIATPAFGAIVTLEPNAASATPSGTALLARAPVRVAEP